MESPRFPTTLSAGAIGGPTWKTEIIELLSGREQRNATWSQPKQRYAVSFENQTQEVMDVLDAFIRNVQGRFDGFRFKDPRDNTCTTTNGRLDVSGFGTGVPAYQLQKIYVTGSRASTRKIRKPVSGSVTIYRSASPVTVGGAPGNISIDYATGIVTFVADSSSAVSGISAGGSTVVTLGANLPQLSIGEKLYLSGITGTIGAALNGLAHAISNIASNVYTISTATTGLTYSGGGTGAAYPQGSESLLWEGPFDVPVRFDVDAMEALMRRTSIGGSFTWDGIQLIELKDDE
jgi:uncharacterized protein (TIGR02217 family)